MNRDILFREDGFVFSLRTAGILIHDGKILLQRPKNDDYAYIGGHVTAFESTEEALVREFREEIHADVAVEKLIAIGEIFFPWGSRMCHQIGMYYLIRLTDPSQIPLEGIFHGYDELDNERIDLDFCWIPLEQFAKETVYPTELTPHIRCGADGLLHFVSRQPEE